MGGRPRRHWVSDLRSQRRMKSELTHYASRMPVLCISAAAADEMAFGGMVPDSGRKGMRCAFVR